MITTLLQRTLSLCPSFYCMCFLTEMNLEGDSGLSVSYGNGKLRQWLIDQINSSSYAGLVWENGEKSIFRIPWKHAGKQDYNRDEDAALFKVRLDPRSHFTILLYSFFLLLFSYYIQLVNIEYSVQVPHKVLLTQSYSVTQFTLHT